MGKTSSILDTLELCIWGDIREETYFLSSAMWLSPSGGVSVTVKGGYTEREEQRAPAKSWGAPSSLRWKKDPGWSEEGAKEKWRMQSTRDGPGISVHGSERLCNHAERHSPQPSRSRA